MHEHRLHERLDHDGEAVSDYDGWFEMMKDCPRDEFSLIVHVSRYKLSRSGTTFGVGWEEEALPRSLMRSSFEHVEDLYRDGGIAPEAWEAFAHVWRTSCARFSNVAAGYEAEPTDPVVIGMVSILKQELRKMEPCR